jgi:hypothetical protein
MGHACILLEQSFDGMTGSSVRGNSPYDSEQKKDHGLCRRQIQQPRVGQSQAIQVGWQTRLLWSVILASVLLRCAALGDELGADNAPAWGQSERSAPATFPDKRRFTLSPDVRLSGTSSFLDRTLVLAQRQTGASGAAATVSSSTSVPAWGTQKSYLIPALEIVGFDVC